VVSNELKSDELSPEQKIILAKSVDKFIQAYETKEQKELAMTRFSMPLN